MAAEEILNLFDSYWFEQAIFTKKPLSSSPPPQESNPVVEIHEEEEEALKKISHLPSLHVRSLSDQNLSSKTSFLSADSLSPSSVLMTTTTKLPRILSGKEVKQFLGDETVKVKEEMKEEAEKPKVMSERRRRRRRIRRRRMKKNGSSKSLTDLEFEELKGFMDLGFVFSEEDHKDSSLVSIIPGLQRMGRNNKLEKQQEEEERVFDKSVVSRPYLSEAWDVLDQRNVKSPILMNWKVPAPGNEVDMKDHLRFWAHIVASTVR